MITQAKFEKVSFEQFYKDFDLYINQKLLNGRMSKDVIREIYNNIELPVRATSKSAGYDFKIPFGCIFKEDTKYIIPTGIRCINMEDDMVLMIYPRSGFGFKYGFRLNNTVGIIDADYENADNEGHIMICVKTDDRFDIEPNKAFCQGIFQKYYTIQNDNVNIIRTGGMGSTDKKNN